MSALDTNSHLVCHGHVLHGVTAEIISVLEDASVVKKVILPGTWPKIIRALDTTIPAEERVQIAELAISEIIRNCKLACWIPRYSNLVDHEFAHEFYPGYRDHSIHSLQVFLLGVYLYELVGTLRSAIESRLQAAVTTKPLPDLFLEWWILASLWHDTGYPFEAVSVATVPEMMKRQLSRIADVLNREIFSVGLEHVSDRLSFADKRELYKAGRFYPITLDSPEAVLRYDFVEQTLDTLWHRLGFLTTVEYPTRELDRLCVQAPNRRESFHDHGFFSAGLLGVAAKEALSFLQNLIDCLSGSNPPRLEGKIRVDAIGTVWEMFENHCPVVTLAMEAIAYHNFSVDYIDEARLAALVGSASRPTPSLEAEPHLFFLGLVDTLQDWDRHHFTPSSRENRFRPAVRANEMLVQGDGDVVRVSNHLRPNAHLIVRDLLRGWLDTKSVSGLIFGDASHTKVDKILAGSTTTIGQMDTSALKREELKRTVDVAVEKAKNCLIMNADTALIEASAIIGDCLKRIDDATAALTASDRDEVAKHCRDSGLSNVEQTSFMLIKHGTRLPMGTVVGHIGDGGFGTVYLVDDAARGGKKTLAFKLFHGHDLLVQEKRRLFRRGYDAMERLAAHPNVVTVYRFSAVPLGFFMDYVPGENLEKALDPKWALLDRMRVARTVAEALAYAHSQGVLHRDVKPSNVLLDFSRNNDPILTDFDLAWIDGRTQHTGSNYATMHCAPEQFQKRLARWTTEPSVDIYGFGALLYFVLTGQEPPVYAQWKDEHLERLSEAIGDLAVASFVKEIEMLVKESTKHEPNERLRDMEQIVARLGKAMLYLESDASLGPKDWILEVMHAAGGGTSLDPLQGFDSRAGGVRWRFENIKKKSGEMAALDAVCSLNREPCFEGVNYRGFAKGSVRQVDVRLAEFNERVAGTRAIRHGQLAGAGSEMKISFLNLYPSKSCARAVGALLSSVSRAVE